jgi:flagellar biosynthesis protein FlhF
MTTELLDPRAVTNGHDATDPELQTFRGRTLEELLPKIREALGPHAVVVRQRDGLMGGVGGFFQQRFVEVEAKPGHARVDVYDEQPAIAAFARELAEAQEQIDAPPAEKLAAEAVAVAAEAPAEPADGPAPVAPKPAARRPRAKAAPKPAARKRTAAKPASAPRRKAVPSRLDAGQLALAVELVERGFGMTFAEALVADAASHLLPFHEGDLRAAVRTALARRIPTPALPAAGGRTVAFVGAGGAGKTRCVTGLAAAHAATGAAVACLTLGAQDGGAELTRRLAPHGVEARPAQSTTAARTALRTAPAGALAILDTPAVSPGDQNAIQALAQQLASLRPDDIHLVMPATLSAPAARELRHSLAPLNPTAVALTHTDATSHLGPAIELACATGLPLAFTADDATERFAPADPQQIAERLLP